jgi:hypothetical protein
VTWAALGGRWFHGREFRERAGIGKKREIKRGAEERRLGKRRLGGCKRRKGGEKRGNLKIRGEEGETYGIKGGNGETIHEEGI